MKSKLFSKKSWLEMDSFKDDIVKLLELSQDVLVQYPQVVVKIHLTRTSDEADVLYANASDLLKVEEAKLRSCFKVCGSFILVLAPDGDGASDNIDDVVDDISSALALSDDDRQKLSAFLAVVRKVSQEDFHEAQRRKEYEVTGLPTLRGVSGNVNLRAIFDTHYKSSISIDNYSPKCEGLTAVAVLKMRLDEESPLEHVFMQMTQKDIRFLIDHLEAMEKQMDALISYVDLEKRAERQK
ncbi:hypothetical protein [Kordiimonas lacus]|uniref:Uncharacterized protein n=1 Tax=Kordiimonas lacus TaxID=637679 RepID=A0A1G7BET6_9PROT|nr:hypothetical protein [Kordiimonas lacus]SDE25512.1 hypothetical protein SAMN04488071_2484 [Kordiimonas lacus]